MVAFRGFARRGLGVFGGSLLVLACLPLSGMTARADEPRCPNCARHSGQAGQAQTESGVTTFAMVAAPSEPVGKGGWLGVRLGEVSEDLRLHLRLPKDQAFLIENVVKGSPAEGRLQRNDIVLAVDGKPASRNWSNFLENMSQKQPGDTLTLNVLRGGERSTLAIKLAARTSNPEAMKLVYEDERKAETAVTCQHVPGSMVGTFHVGFPPGRGPQYVCAIAKDNKTYRFQMEDKKLVVTVSDPQGKELTKLFTTREDLEKADQQLYKLYQEASANRLPTNVGYMTLKIKGDGDQEAKQSGRIVVQSITGNMTGGAQLQTLLGPGNAPTRPGQPVEAAERAKARTIQPLDISGTWYWTNLVCSIIQNGNKLTLTNQLSDTQPGTFTSSATISVPNWGQTATITSIGDTQTIHWATGDKWTRKFIPANNSPAAMTFSGVLQAQPKPYTGCFCAGCPMAQTGRPGQPGMGGPVTVEARRAREQQETPEVMARLQAELQALLARQGQLARGGPEVGEAGRARERQEDAERTKARNIQPPDLSGTWLYKSKPCKVIQKGKVLTFVNERGEQSTGSFITNNSVKATDWSNLSGSITSDLSTIHWANNTSWTRYPQNQQEAGEGRRTRERQEAAEVMERVRAEAQARMGTPEQRERRVQEAREHARTERAGMQPGPAVTWDFMPGVGGVMTSRPMTIPRPLPPGFSPWVAPAATPSFTVALNGEITAEVTTPAGSIRKTFANEGELRDRAPGLYRKYQKLAEELK